MRANTTSWIYSSVSAFQTALVSTLSLDLEQQLYHQPPNAAHVPDGWLSLSWSGVLNFIPLTILSGWTVAAIASPVSPLNPDTLRRYLSVSGPIENDEYSTEYQSPLSLWIWKHIRQVSFRLDADPNDTASTTVAEKPRGAPHYKSICITLYWCVEQALSHGDSDKSTFHFRPPSTVICLSIL